MAAHLAGKLESKVVVRSDDIDGNEIIGTVDAGDRSYTFRALCSDDGEVESSVIEPR